MTERLRDDLDTFAEEHGYTGRSEVIREACQSLLEEYQHSDDEDRLVLATVTAMFGYDEPDIESRMMDIRHEYETSVRSNSHICLEDREGCVETFVIEAKYSDILQFIGTVQGVDESISIEYTATAIDVVSTEIEQH